MKIILKLKNYLKNIKWSAISLCLLFSAEGVFVQQSAEELAVKYDLSFPIKALGGCANFAECRHFCEDPVNNQICITYAQQKGFYEVESSRVEQAVSNASKELGCKSEESCRAFCDNPQNFDKCKSFAKKYDLANTDVLEGHKLQVLDKAKEVLGCNSLSSCKEFCEQEENRVNCAEFAKQTGIRGGVENRGPGGCTSPHTCGVYCSLPDHFYACSQFVSTTSDSPQIQFRGPGGCDSEISCRAYCNNNPKDCGIVDIQTEIKPIQLPQKEDEFSRFCREDPAKCSYEKYCAANPTSCTTYSPHTKTYSSQFHTDETMSCKTPAECYDYCKANPDKCPSFDPNYPKPSEGPLSYCSYPASGCPSNSYWDYGSCSCKSSSSGTSSGTTESGTSGADSSPYPTYTPSGSYSYPSPSYYYPTPGSSYSYPSPSYYTPGYSYPTPGSYSYPSPSYSYPSPSSGSYSYPSPLYSYPTPLESYSYPTPSYGTPAYGTPSYSYPTPSQSMEEECKSHPGCTWTGSSCQCTQGVSYKLTPELAQKYGVSFPITELNNCNDCGSCNDFCSIPANRDKCQNFATQTGLINEEENFKKEVLSAAKEQLGCTSEESCRELCLKEENQSKCVEFATNEELIEQHQQKLTPPIITTHLLDQTLTASQLITFIGQKDTAVEIYLQPQGTTDLIFAGRGFIRGDDGKLDFTFDTKNFPNGSYKLISKSAKAGELSLTATTTEINIDNSASTDPVTATTADVIFPSQFDPEQVPISSDTKIDSIKNTTSEDQDTAITFEGKALPNTVITLLIFSNPIVVTVKTDANGVWKYNLEKPLEPGKHVAYVAVPTKQGKIRSEVSEFVITPALAAEAAGNESLLLESATTENITNKFIIMAVVLIGAGVLGLFALFYFKNLTYSRKLNNDTNLDDN